MVNKSSTISHHYPPTSNSLSSSNRVTWSVRSLRKSENIVGVFFFFCFTSVSVIPETETTLASIQWPLLLNIILIKIQNVYSWPTGGDTTEGKMGKNIANASLVSGIIFPSFVQDFAGLDLKRKNQKVLYV